MHKVVESISGNTFYKFITYQNVYIECEYDPPIVEMGYINSHFFYKLKYG